MAPQPDSNWKHRHGSNFTANWKHRAESTESFENLGNCYLNIHVSNMTFFRRVKAEIIRNIRNILVQYYIREREREFCLVRALLIRDISHHKYHTRHSQIKYLGCAVTFKTCKFDWLTREIRYPLPGYHWDHVIKLLGHVIVVTCEVKEHGLSLVLIALSSGNITIYFRYMRIADF